MGDKLPRHCDSMHFRQFRKAVLGITLIASIALVGSIEVELFTGSSCVTTVKIVGIYDMYSRFIHKRQFFFFALISTAQEEKVCHLSCHLKSYTGEVWNSFNLQQSVQGTMFTCGFKQHGFARQFGDHRVFCTGIRQKQLTVILFSFILKNLNTNRQKFPQRLILCGKNVI